MSSLLGSDQSDQVVLPGVFYLHMQNLRGTQAVFDLIKEAGNSFQHVLKSFTSNATIMLSYKCPIIGKQIAVILFYITGYHSNDMTC